MGLVHLADEETNANYVTLSVGERARVHRWKVCAEPIQMARQV